MCGYTSQGIFHEGLLQIQQILYQGMGSLGVESWTHAGRAKVREVKTTSRACSLFPPRTTLVLCIRGVLYMHILLVVCIEYFMHITIAYQLEYAHSMHNTLLYSGVVCTASMHIMMYAYTSQYQSSNIMHTYVRISVSMQLQRDNVKFVRTSLTCGCAACVSVFAHRSRLCVPSSPSPVTTKIIGSAATATPHQQQC